MPTTVNLGPCDCCGRPTETGTGTAGFYCDAVFPGGIYPSNLYVYWDGVFKATLPRVGASLVWEDSTCGNHVQCQSGLSGGLIEGWYGGPGGLGCQCFEFYYDLVLLSVSPLHLTGWVHHTPILGECAEIDPPVQIDIYDVP